jgi:chorismate mutase/prephenate dehydrogenase
MTELSKLRADLALVDRDVVRLMGKRQRLVRAIGELKNREASALRDFAQEKRVLDRARTTALRQGISPDLAERVLSILIESSLTTQEQQRVTARSGGVGQRALVIGGAGRMGGWLVQFLLSQGFRVEVADPANQGPGLSDWRESPLDHDLIIVATPLRVSARILGQLARRRPAGVVFDVGSLKTPLFRGLQQLVRAGVRTTSIHPLFGPDTRLLAGRHVIVVDLGVPEANETAQALFAPTMAEVVTMDLASHDRLMAYVLGMSHALNIAFFTALQSSGFTAAELARLSSTTFDRQLAVATPVARENPLLYFEIQKLNRFGGAALDGLADAVDMIRKAVRKGDEATFVSLMERGREWLAGRPAVDRRNRSA